MRKILFILVYFLFTGCSIKVNKPALSGESLSFIKANLEFLASDELEGRESTRRGSKTAAQFIANQFKQYDLVPFGDNGTYFQDFALQNTTFMDSSRMAFFYGDSISLTFADNFIPFQAGEPITKSEIIYMGYGISDSALAYDDYKNTDVVGKTVVCLFGIPFRKNDPEYFKNGKNWNGSIRKAKVARENGAKAIIILQSNKWVKNWSLLADNYINGSIGKLNEDKEINAVWIDSLTIKKLFSLDHLNYDQIRDTLNNGYIKSGTLLNSRCSINIIKKTEKVMARNVLGYIKGHSENEARLTILGAHYDHNGIKGGEIYNGADDNASGTSALLEVARQLSKTNNRNPVLICFWDAEEKGLLGSEYFAENYNPKSNIQTYINIDMVGREHLDSIYTYGAKFYSKELYNLVEKSNIELSAFVLDYSYDDLNHPERPYQRSDHWNFGKYKIPFVAFSDKHNGKKINDYHKPTDTSEKINYTKIKKLSHLVRILTLKLANLNHDLQTDQTAYIGEK